MASASPAPRLLDRLRDAWARGASPWRGLRDGPVCDADGRTPVEGVWVAGDLADAPVLKGALNHGDRVGRAVAEALAAVPPDGNDDVLILGAGPAGCAAALALREAGRRVRIVERAEPFDTLARFPTDKVLYAEPRGVPVPDGLAFDDAPAAEIVDRWTRAVDEAGLPVLRGTEALEAQREGSAWRVRVRRGDGAERWLEARHVVIAVGRRGAPRRLGVPGDDLPHVHDRLADAAAHAGEAVVVVGAGDSAAEAALALAVAGAEVTLLVRGEGVVRPRPATLAALDTAIADGRLLLRPRSQVSAVLPDRVRVRGPEGEAELPATTVFALLGADAPRGLLATFGVPRRSRVLASEVAWISAFVAFVWCFYVLKTGRPWFPFHPGGPLAAVPDLLTVHVATWPTVDGGGRTFGPGFWGTVLYTLAIAGFGLAAVRRHDTPPQRRRYASLVAFQAVVLFGVPELLAPLVTGEAHHVYDLGVPWPLRIDSLAPASPALGWSLAAAFVSFVALPWFVVRHNERFCSWMCGCGGLAETVGDLFRHRAPRGPLARRAEGAGRLVLGLAIPVTLLVLADTWSLVAPTTWLAQEVVVEAGAVRLGDRAGAEGPGAERLVDVRIDDDDLVFTVEIRRGDAWVAEGWVDGLETPQGPVWATKEGSGRHRVPLAALPEGRPVEIRAASSPLSSVRHFARGWYGLIVDFALASVLGVALYPMLGNRVWCRFFCPLRAYMEWIAARWGRLAIVADETCIACGTCTAACQMGIDVQGFAEKQVPLDNAHSACIQCGVCVEVCPMDTLSLVDRSAEGLPAPDPAAPSPRGPRWGAAGEATIRPIPARRG